MAAEDKTIVLVTGANGGIGYELVNQLCAKEGFHVLLGSRSIEKGNAAVKEISSKHGGAVELLQIDCQDDDSIAAAAKTIESKFGRLDVLVNNAAVALSKAPTLRQKMIETFNTNAAGIAVIGYTFQPLLRKSKGQARMVNVSSGVGSITGRLDPSFGAYNQNGEFAMPYRTSKASENMVTAHLSVGFKADKETIKVFSYCPGFTVSNLSHMNTAENGARPTADSVYPLVDIIEGKRDDEQDVLLHGKGTYPW